MPSHAAHKASMSIWGLFRGNNMSPSLDQIADMVDLYINRELNIVLKKAWESMLEVNTNGAQCDFCGCIEKLKYTNIIDDNGDVIRTSYVCCKCFENRIKRITATEDIESV